MYTTMQETQCEASRIAHREINFLPTPTYFEMQSKKDINSYRRQEPVIITTEEHVLKDKRTISFYAKGALNAACNF